MNKYKKLLSYFAIAGNIIYILWVLYNGINEGFSGINTIAGIAMLGLMILLALNAYLLLGRQPPTHTGQ